jgi:hypothetical protein
VPGALHDRARVHGRCCRTAFVDASTMPARPLWRRARRAPRRCHAAALTLAAPETRYLADLKLEIIAPD